mmetsp:Transcript_43296/g.112527  ORF Transcript_43296/g.112527 Transcript_43296/m.112527 type:complete len:516 (-) Transcript_43296:1195-2742(-)
MRTSGGHPGVPKQAASPIMPDSIISAFPSRGGIRPSSVKLQGAVQPFVGIQGSSAISRQAKSKQRDLIGGGVSGQTPQQSSGDDREKVVFVESAKHPGVPVLYRNKAEKSASLERLNLDRRKLTVCPILCGEEQLRLLNYQNNLITKIENLNNLPNLIFLDLYSNQIRRVEAMEFVPSLRVLMLGKNEIEVIEGLEPLKRLDVLDLHSNKITSIENLGHLRDLRVLNLAGNRIMKVENLRALSSLTEINLRRNKIEVVVDLDHLPYLQRVFLSNNCIESFDNVSCLFGVKYLSELSLDGNPVATTAEYRTKAVMKCKALRHLDLRRVTDDEKKAATAVEAEEARRHERARNNARIEIVPPSVDEVEPTASPTKSEKGGLEIATGRISIKGDGILSLERAVQECEGAGVTTLSISSCDVLQLNNTLTRTVRVLLLDANITDATSALVRLRLSRINFEVLPDIMPVAQLLAESNARSSRYRPSHMTPPHWRGICPITLCLYTSACGFIWVMTPKRRQ